MMTTRTCRVVVIEVSLNRDTVEWIWMPCLHGLKVVKIRKKRQRSVNVSAMKANKIR